MNARSFWVQFNPSGCAVGSVLAGVVGASAEDAHKRFTPKAADRRRETTEGYRHELLVHDEWKRRAEPCFLGRCNH